MIAKRESAGAPCRARPPAPAGAATRGGSAAATSTRRTGSRWRTGATRSSRRARRRSRASTRPRRPGLPLAGRAGAGADTPAVLEVDERWLALEWVEPGRAQHGRRGGAGARAGRHPPGGRRAVRRAARGRRRTTGFGSLRLPNEPTGRTGRASTRERRLLPLAAIARERARAVSEAGGRAVEGVCERIARAVRAARAALAAARRPVGRQRDGRRRRARLADRPVLLRRASRGRPGDAARCSARRRERIFDAYEEAAPLAAGAEERVALYQLAPLLVHAALFGGSYGAAAERAARRYSKVGGG